MTITRFLSLLLSFFLGFLSCIGAIVGVGYYAYAKVSFDKLEQWGVVSVDEGQYVDEEADVDLTSMTIKAFISEIKELQNLNETVSIDLLVDRWGLKIPDEIMEKIPSGVRTLAVKEIFSPSGISAILEHTDVSYLFQFLPADVLAEPAREALTGKTLKEVVDLKMTDLLSGMKLGYLAGIQYEKDASGRYIPVYKDPANPTLLELMASLDLGKTLDVVGNGGDLLAVINDGMNDVLIDLLIKSVSSGDNETMNRLLAGKTIGDVIVEDPDTGALSLDLGVIVNGKKAGDLLGYTPVYLDDDADRGIIVDWLDADGARVKGAMRAIADGTVSGLGGEFDVNDLLVNSYLGFFQEFDPVFDSEGNITGWLKGDGNPPDRLERTLANKKLTTMLDDGFSIDNLVSGLYVGDLMGYTPVEDGEGNVVGWKTEGGEDLDRVTEALAKQSVEKLMDGDFEIDDALEGLYVGDLLKYTPVKDDPLDAEKITGWKAEDGSDLDRVSESLAKKQITELTSGDFEVGDVLEGLYVGDLLKYTPIKDDPLDPEKVTGWLDKDNKEVGGLDRATANIDLYRLVNDDGYKVSDAFDEVYLGEAMGYHHGADPLPKADPSDPTHYQWYKTKDAVSGDLSNPTVGIEQKLANYFLGDLIDGKITSDELTKGMPLHELLNLKSVQMPLYDENCAPIIREEQQVLTTVWYTTYIGPGDPGNVRASDAISALADCTIDGISDQVNGVHVGSFTGYVLFETKWYKGEVRYDDFDGDSENEEGFCLSPSSGILASLADLTVNQLSDNNAVTEKVKLIYVGDAMGYEEHEGVWYYAGQYDELHPENGRVTGMMKAIAHKKVGEMDTISSTMPIGQLLGYDPVYLDPADTTSAIVGWTKNGAPVEPGVMLAISDFTIDGLETGIGGVYIGEVLGYTPVYDLPDHPDVVIGWLDNGNPVSGIMKPFAGLTIDQMKVSSNVTNAVQEVYIGDAMGYEEHAGVWYYAGQYDELHPENGRVTGMMKALAPKKVSQMGSISSETPIGELLGYEKHGGIWYSAYDSEHPENGKVEPGVILAISDFTIDGLETGIGGVYLGEVMGYTPVYDLPDHPDVVIGWLDNGNPVSGIMKPFAGLTIDQMKVSSNVTNAVQEVYIGDAMGYEEHAGVWYYAGQYDEPHPENGRVTGMMKALAPKKVSEMGSVSSETPIGELLGYVKVGNVWYESYTSELVNVPASSMIQAIADSTIDSLSGDLNTIKVGKFLGYSYDLCGVAPDQYYWWCDNGVETSTIINTLSSETMGTLGPKLSNLTLADLFSPEELSSGFLSLFLPTTTLTQLGRSGDEPGSITYIFLHTTMQQYMDAGLINLEARAGTLDVIAPGWRTKTIQQFLDAVIPGA